MTRVNDVYNDFSSGDLFQTIELFRLHPNSLQIQIGTDDFEICNPLGSKSKLHKITAFYFTIRNVPQKYRSKLNNIYLLLLCNSDDLKTKYTDVNDVLRPIVREVKYLEETGIRVGETDLLGTLSNLSYDNLGANFTLCLNECFSASPPFCRMCVCTRDEAQRLCVETPSKIRNREMYQHQLEIIAASEKVNLTETQGVKRYCVLNDLKHFNIFENFSVDIMHDLNEGCIPFLLKHTFNYCIKNKILTEENLVQKFQFYDYGFLNLDQTPSVINLSKHNLNQNASQAKCLFLHVPFVLFTEQQTTTLKSIWKCVESLLIIVQISYSSEIREADLTALNENIRIHLESLQEVFGVTLLAKHHFLTHYVRVIRLMGSLVPMSMIRYEAEHKILKRIARTANNFKNITKTIANMHQQATVTVVDSYEDHHSNGLKTSLPQDYIDTHCSLLIDYFELESEIHEFKWVKYNEWKYKKGLSVFFDKVLCEINRILLKENRFLFIVKKFQVLSFFNCLNSVQIKELYPNVFLTVEFSQLEHQKVYEKKILNGKFYLIIDTLETQRCIEME